MNPAPTPVKFCGVTPAALRMLLMPFSAGVLLPFGFAPYYWWPLVFPAIWLLTESLYFQKPKLAALQGWLFGTGFFGVGVSWVYVSIHEHGNASAPLAFFLTALFVAAMSLFPTLQFYLTAKLTPAKNQIYNSLSFLCLWALFEWFRSWFLTGFPWLFLGNAFIESPLAGWGPVVGVYGVSTLAMLSALVLQWCWSQRQQPNVAISLIVVAVIWIGGWRLQSVAWTSQGESIKVSMVQANIAQADKWIPANKQSITRHYLSLTENLWGSDLIIWPETALPYFMHQAKTLLNALDSKAKSTQTALALGILSAEFKPGEATKIHNSFTVVGEGKGLYYKQKLVPFGEYVPLESLLRGLIEFFDLPMSDLQAGTSAQSALSFRDKKLMPLICYEVVYPDFVASYARQADLLVTVSNDSWFGTSIGPHQHLQMAQMRALETQKYVLRATNNGITAIINPQGRIDVIAPQFKSTVLSGNASFRPGSTPFMLTGSWPVLTLLVLLACWCGFKVRKRSLTR
jgi:apolipoprotein N-acyltransferase